MDNDAIKRLRALAERATRGNWEHASRTGVYCNGWVVAATHSRVDGKGYSPDAAYIAAASPDVLLALLNERDAAMALLRECRAIIGDLDESWPGLVARIDALLGDGGEG